MRIEEPTRDFRLATELGTRLQSENGLFVQAVRKMSDTKKLEGTLEYKSV